MPGIAVEIICVNLCGELLVSFLLDLAPVLALMLSLFKLHISAFWRGQ